MPIPTEALPPRPLLRDTVADRLREAIVDGTLAPDEQLRDADLAAWLGVSRTPVREALLDLARAGLVQARPGRSTSVAPLDPQAVHDAQTVVAAMHRIAVEEAVPKMGAADIQRMRDANAAFGAARARGDWAAAHAADREFHAVAVDVSGNRAVRSVLADYEPVLLRAERLRFASSEGDDSERRHADLIERCAAGDAAGAAALAERTWSSLRLDRTASPASAPDPQEIP